VNYDVAAGLVPSLDNLPKFPLPEGERVRVRGKIEL
jgi:hypothetical protein